jgi:hypothetical protein
LSVELRDEVARDLREELCEEVKVLHPYLFVN